MAELLADRRRKDVRDRGKEASRPRLSTGPDSARRPNPFNAAGRLGGTGAPGRAGIGDGRHGHDSG
eukprot:7566293-Alexandrium_andersonii.AAC.1